MMIVIERSRTRQRLIIIASTRDA